MGGSDSSDSIPGEIHSLDLETLKWSCPSTAKLGFTLSGHANTIVNRTKLMVCGGNRNRVPGIAVAHLSTDTMKWQVAKLPTYLNRLQFSSRTLVSECCSQV